MRRTADRAVRPRSGPPDPLPGSAAGRGDLVRLIKALPAAERAAAALTLGLVPAPDAPVRTLLPDLPGAVPGPADTTAPGPPEAPPDLPFWRIAAEWAREPDATAAPTWLAAALPCTSLPVSDPRQPRPLQPELVPRPRLARFLRRHLAVLHPGPDLDLDRLCRLLAARRLPRRLPCRCRPRWPSRVDLVLDLALALRPYWEDFWQLERDLRRLLGARLCVWHARGGDPRALVSAVDGRPGALPAGAGALVVLSDGGLYAPGSGRYRAWADLGRRAAGPGAAGPLAPLLIAPVPPRLADPRLIPGYRLVPWDRGARLRPLGPAAAVVTPSPLVGEGWGGGAEPGTEALLAALALASRVEPPLLRALRLALDGEGTDIGAEYAVWNHPRVHSNLLACALDPEHRPVAEAALRRLPEPLPRRISTLRYDYNRHQSPLIQAEEALAEGTLAPPEALDTALALVRSLGATLERGSDPAMGRALAAYVVHLAGRRPELLASPKLPGRRELAAAWVLARRDDLRRGALKDIPPGVDLETLAGLLGGRDEAPPAVLGQTGEALGLYPADGTRPACPLAAFTPGADWWQAEALSPDGAEAPPPRVLHLGEALPLDPESRHRLSIGRHRLDLETVRRPAWAEGLGREADGLFAELPEGRRLWWVPAGRLAVAGLDGGIELARGAWWDQDEYRAWLAAGRRLTRPDWAVRHGIDGYGWWAEFEVKGVVQRMRWIAPGEFRMGSPQDEPERFGSGEWGETPHPVLLSRAFWLADTACTQALWEAVLGENPSGFNGRERPVEQVTWTDVTGRFLPALNARVPGPAAGLPTEAQWEYGCRAGTTGPFSFGSNITTDQVNYDGNHPYPDGAKGQYRQETVEVKALPANAWGLYQMHGNVWEWCADWLGEYPDGAVVDPVGPSEGRVRVLRGGSWIYHARSCRSAIRSASVPGYRHDIAGFRLSRGSSPRPAAAGGVGVAGVVAGAGAPASAPAAPTPGPRAGPKKRGAKRHR